MTTTTNLATQTPPEIDTELARIFGEIEKAQQQVAFATDDVHHMAADMRLDRYGNKVHGIKGRWAMTDAEAIAALEANGGPIAHGYISYTGGNRATEAIEKLEAAQDAVTDLIATTVTLEDEYRRRPWSRFFLVHDGHIHSSMACSTCYPTTRFGWLPGLSGLTEKDAVDAHGPLLCSICFPSAPVEWCVGPQPKMTDKCPGSGTYQPKDDRANWHRPWAKCPECGEAFNLTSTGKLRAHKPPKAKK